MSKTARGLLRTPEERFLVCQKAFPYEPHYVTDLDGFEGIRIHYIDEQTPSAKALIESGADPSTPGSKVHTYLCLHGEPSWSFLYRKMIPILMNSGGKSVRVVCPDLVGFGRSDKFVDESQYSFQMHRELLIQFVTRLELRNITLICQDWGGMLGLTLPLALPNRFVRLLAMNTGFALGVPLGPGFQAWKEYALRTPDLPVGAIIKRGTPHLTDEEKAAYDAPYPDPSFKAGARVFPKLVPDAPGAPGADIQRQAAAWWNKSKIPVVAIIGSNDPVIGKPGMIKLIRQFGGPTTVIEIPEAGHFVQEWADKFTERALESFKFMARQTRERKELKHDEENPTAKL